MTLSVGDITRRIEQVKDIGDRIRDFTMILDDMNSPMQVVDGPTKDEAIRNLIKAAPEAIAVCNWYTELLNEILKNIIIEWPPQAKVKEGKV